MYFVYILSISNKQLYVGYTNNIRRRIAEHKQGKSDFTRRHLPLRLIFYEAYINEQDARRREKYFKTSKGKTSLRIMLKETLSA